MGLVAIGLLVLLAAGDGAAQSGLSVAWGTYLGGTSFLVDEGRGVAVDSDGNVYATGNTNSSGWVSGGWDPTFDGTSDSYVVKLSATGAHLWSTYLGGTDWDYGYGIAVDSSGNACVTGQTASSGWVSGGWDTSYNGGIYGDGYVVKLDTAGAHLWSTYLGGTDNDAGQGIALDLSDNMYVTGFSASSGWVSEGWDTISNGLNDGYVVKLDTEGAHLWSTYLGGEDYDEGYGIAVDLTGNAYATGRTWSSGWVSKGWDTTFGVRRTAMW